VSSFAQTWKTSFAHKVAHKALIWSGMASGIAITLALAFIARTAAVHTGGLIYAMIAVNIVMLVPWSFRTMPEWLYGGLAMARGFHWIVNLMFAGFGLLLLAHAHELRSAIAFGGLSIMFALWAAAARRLTHRDPEPVTAAG
jgi:FtsH-binding integral membrane protein